MNFTKKPAKTGPSAATTLILFILFAMVACYALFQISQNAGAAYNTAAAYDFEADDATTVTGYVVREEQIGRAHV